MYKYKITGKKRDRGAIGIFESFSETIEVPYKLISENPYRTIDNIHTAMNQLGYGDKWEIQWVKAKQL